jgi:hypothetical protein
MAAWRVLLERDLKLKPCRRDKVSAGQGAELSSGRQEIIKISTGFSLKGELMSKIGVERTF